MHFFMDTDHVYQIFPLGDSALTLELGNVVEEGINNKIMQIFSSLTASPLPGMIEAVPAYSSITVYYDVSALHQKINSGTVYNWIKHQLQLRLQQPMNENEDDHRLIKIPVCYSPEFGIDLAELSITTHLSAEEIISTHCSKAYRVYMLGFLPGFAYMGPVDKKISVPRRSQPRQQIAAGSVGLAGQQTGIYPMASPGGWQIIGRTPLKLFSPSNDPPALLNPGDKVQFYSISKNEFENY
jgi:inhibitor of KinA